METVMPNKTSLNRPTTVLGASIYGTYFDKRTQTQDNAFK